MYAMQIDGYVTGYVKRHGSWMRRVEGGGILSINLSVDVITIRMRTIIHALLITIHPCNFRFRSEKCYRCLFIAFKHHNVLQYKECKWITISFSFVSVSPTSAFVLNDTAVKRMLSNGFVRSPWPVRNTDEPHNDDRGVIGLLPNELPRKCLNGSSHLVFFPLFFCCFSYFDEGKKTAGKDEHWNQSRLGKRGKEKRNKRRRVRRQLLPFSSVRVRGPAVPRYFSVTA